MSIQMQQPRTVLRSQYEMRFSVKGPWRCDYCHTQWDARLCLFCEQLEPLVRSDNGREPQ